MRQAIVLTVSGLILCALGWVRAEAGPGTAKVGYVDLQKTLNETKAGKKARGRLELQKKKKQEDINKKEAALKKFAEDLDKQRAVLKPDVLRQRERELQDKYVELQSVFMQLQQELAKEEAKLTRDIFNDAAKHIETIAKREGFTMMFEKSESAVLWADPSLEITKEVNALMDK